VAEIKLTSNLIKEISFNSTVNRFEYLEQLLRREHDEFIATVTRAINRQVILPAPRRKSSGR
jgi:hypothetical protein